MFEKHYVPDQALRNLEVRFIGDVHEKIAGYITPSPIK